MQNMDMIKEHINDALYEDEVILWAGRPGKARLLDAPYGTPIMIRWFICLIIAAFAFWYRFSYIPSVASTSVNGDVVMLVILVIAVLIALLPFKDIIKLNRNCFYYITDHRVISLVRGSSSIMNEKHYSDVSEITYDMHATDVGNIYIGKKEKTSENKARIRVLTRPVEDGEEHKRPLIFYNVNNPDKVMGFFPSLNTDN